MSTDIHALDQYIGQYVSVEDAVDGKLNSASGFVVDVDDQLQYNDEVTSRLIVFDWGQGWLVSEHTKIEVFPGAPEGQKCPAVNNPLDIIHQQMHAEFCSDQKCELQKQAFSIMRSLRVWRMRQSDEYWKREYVNKARAWRDDPCSVSEVLQDAVHEGAPPHIVDSIKDILRLSAKENGYE